MPLTPINPSSRGGNGKGDKKSTEDRILEVFAERKRATAADVFKEFELRGWETPKSNVINSTLARLTNEGLLRQFGKDDENNTVWERTPLKTPLEDTRIHEDTARAILVRVQGGLQSIGTIGKRGDVGFKPDYDLLSEFAQDLKKIIEKIDGYQDRSNEPEFKRRVSLGL